MTAAVFGALYARTDEPQAAFRVYRHGFLRRERKRLSIPPEVSEQVLIDRLARDQSLPNEARRWLIDGELPNSDAELVRAVRAIESIPD